jgi:hypothetical protein
MGKIQLTEEGGGDGKFQDPVTPRFFVDSEAGLDDDTFNGLSENAPFQTLAKAYTAALAEGAPKKIIILSDISEEGVTTLDPADGQAQLITITGGSKRVTLERSAGADDSVLEVLNGAQVHFENIWINGKIDADNAVNKNNRALRVDGAGTKVILGDRVVITGKKVGISAGTVYDQAGSGILVDHDAELEMAGNSTVTGCEQNGGNLKGAVAVMNGGRVIMNGGTISNNTAIGDGSAACYGTVYIADGGSFTLNSGAVSGNEAFNTGSFTSGCAFYITSGGELIMNDGEISNNTNTNTGNNGASEGGGVYVGNGTFTMNNGSIKGNVSNGSARPARGGGVYLYGSGQFIMYDGVISGNMAIGTASDGGGVFARKGAFIMYDGVISGNAAIGVSVANGGGVSIGAATDGSFTMNSGVISGNIVSGTAAYGGGVYKDAGSFTMNGGTVYGNETAVSALLRNIITPDAANNGAAFYKTANTANPTTQQTTNSTIAIIGTE